jgi:hypothetical protein
MKKLVVPIYLLTRAKARACSHREQTCEYRTIGVSLPIQIHEVYSMKEAFVCDAIRTPFGRYGGTLAITRTDDLAAIPMCIGVGQGIAVVLERC